MDQNTPAPAPTRRRHLWPLVAAIAVLAAAGLTVALVATSSGSHHHAAQDRPSPVAATDAASESATDIVDGPTCKQFLDSYLGKYSLGEEPNVWAGHLLADLIGADGIAMQLDGLTQAGFAIDLNEACLDPSVFNTPAKAIGGSVYRANKSKYTHRP